MAAHARRILVAGFLALGLAALGATPARAVDVVAHGGKVHGFRLSVVVGTTYEFGQATGEDAAVRLSRTRRGQTLTRSLRPGRVRLAASKRLAKAHLRMNLGSHGRVNLRFHPTGRLHEVGEGNCEDFTPIRARRGVFTGVVVARMGGPFGVVRRARLKTTLTLTDAAACSDPDPMGGDHELAIADPGFDASLYDLGVADVTAPRLHGRHWSRQDDIHVEKGNLLTADTTTTAAEDTVSGPFLAGALHFEADDPGEEPLLRIFDVPHYEVPGRVTGGLTARFDRVGGAKRTLTVPHPATFHGDCNQCI